MRQLTALLSAAGLLAGVVAPEAVAAPAATFVGKTAQKRSIKLTVSGSTLRLLSFTAELRGRDGSTLLDQESGFEPTKIRSGRFRDTQFGSTDKVQFSGRLKGRVITGTIRVSDRLAGGVRCDSKQIKFSVRRR